MKPEDVSTPLDLAYFCVRGASEGGDALMRIRQFLKGDNDGNYGNCASRLVLPARTVGLSYPIVCGWTVAEGIVRDEATWFGMGTFLHDAGMPTREMGELFKGQYNDHYNLWRQVKYVVCWDWPPHQNPFLQPAEDLRPNAPWHASAMSEKLWDETLHPGDPWHALWLLLNSVHRPESAWRAYERLIADDEIKKCVLEDFLLPPIVAALCAGLLTEPEIAVFGHGEERPEVWQSINEFETVRFAAEYAAVALALPELGFDDVESLLGYPGKGEPTASLKTALAHLKDDWPRFA